MLPETMAGNPPRSIVTDHYLLDLLVWGRLEKPSCEEVLLMMMYDLEKASKSASSISLYVSDNPEGSDEVLGPAGAVFPDQEARPVI
jgi:hypothetical protein